MKKAKILALLGSAMLIAVVGSLMVAPAFARGPEPKDSVCHYQDADKFGFDSHTVGGVGHDGTVIHQLSQEGWALISINGNGKHAVEAHLANHIGGITDAPGDAVTPDFVVDLADGDGTLTDCNALIAVNTNVFP